MDAEGESTGLNPPLRQPSGALGRPVCLNTNYFAIKTKAEVNLVQYEVSIKQDTRRNIKIGQKQNMKIFEKMKTRNRDVFSSHPLAFDGFKKAYSVEVLSSFKEKETITFKVNHELEEDDGDPVSFTIKISLSMTISLRELMESLKCTNIHKRIHATIFRMLETMLRYRRLLRYETVGKRYFSLNREINRPIDIGPAVQGVTGFFSSMKASAHEKGSIMINIDIAHAAFYKEQPLLDFIKNVLHVERNDLHAPLDIKLRKRLECGLADLRVETTHRPRTYRIIGLGMYGPDRQTFPWNDNVSGKIEQRTVQDYFEKEYRKPIKYPRLICIQAFPEEKNIYLPLEYCVIARGQRSVGNLSNSEAGNFIRSSAIPPGKRLQQIKSIYNDNEFANDEMIRSLQFEMAKSPFTVTGRVLSPPKLRMGQEVKPQTGEWDTRNVKFYIGAVVNTWAVINYTNTWEGALEKYIRNLRSLGNRKGMVFKAPVSVTKGMRESVTQNFQNLKKKFPDIQMILVVLKDADPLYSRIKTVGDLNISVITQCVKQRCVEECRFVTIGNLLFKINAKMGGINYIWSRSSKLMEKRLMVMGADVNHPSAGDVRTPSMAAVVASMDKFVSKYAVEVRPQKHRNEIIQDFKEMTKNLLKSYLAANNCKPQHIIVYRDGVSDIQFSKVLQHEFLAIREACQELEETHKPSITFLVVMKRHHTRFFPVDGTGKNIPPGTVVDSGITHPIERDFFLCSHHGIKGTSRPTHYHVLWDDNNLTMDQLQEFTYNMCHVYSRCSKSVSLPAPVAYAHLAAFRAKVHATEVNIQESELKHIKMNREKELSNKLYYI